MVQASEAELLVLVEDLGLKPEDVKLQSDATLYELRKLAEPIETSIKEHEAKRAFASSLEDRKIVKNLKEEIFSLFPNYAHNREMHKCNYGVSKRSITLDAGLLSSKLLERLERCENFTLKCNSEVNLVRASRSSGMVSSLSIVGKSFQEIPADLIVLCTGAHTARFLYQTLSVYAPLVPIKSYMFEMPTKSPFTPVHLKFPDSALMAVMLEPGTWLMSAFGDIAGLNSDLDGRRARWAKNTACLTIDKEEGLMARNIQGVLRTCSPDDLPVVGALKRYPNLYVNTGHGGRTCAVSLACSKIVSEQVKDSASQH